MWQFSYMEPVVHISHYVHAHADLLRKAAASLNNGPLAARIANLANELEHESRWFEPPSAGGSEKSA